MPFFGNSVCNTQMNDFLHGRGAATPEKSPFSCVRTVFFLVLNKLPLRRKLRQIRTANLAANHRCNVPSAFIPKSLYLDSQMATGMQATSFFLRACLL